MLLVLPVDLDDDLGRKTGLSTPAIGRDAVAEAAVSLATVDPEDSDVNVLFEGIRVYEELGTAADEEVEVAAVTGLEGGEVAANRAVGEEVDEVLAALQTGEDVRVIVITDGAQDESVLPVIRSRVPIDGVQRVVVRQAQNLESMYYTIKQVLADPETRGTILVPLGVLLLVYPFVVVASALSVEGANVLGLVSAVLGLYTLFRGLGLETAIDDATEQARNVLYAGRVTLVTYVVAVALVSIGIIRGVETIEAIRGVQGSTPPLVVVSAFVHGAIRWIAAAGITSSFGQVTDEYLADRFRWRYLNAPVYVGAIALVLYAVSGFFLPAATGVDTFALTEMALALTAGTLLAVLSTLTLAVVESRNPEGEVEAA